MPPAGDELLALWREAGEWWIDEPPCEVRRFLDGNGHLREESRLLPHPDADFGEAQYMSVRALKAKDDKVVRACGSYTAPEFSTIDAKPARYAALHVQSGHTFGRSAMIAEAIPAHPVSRRFTHMLLADLFSLGGAVEFATMACNLGIHPLVGATFEMADGGELVLVARTQHGFKSLSQLITECHLNEPRLYPLCTWERLERYSQGLICLTGGDPGPVNRLLIRSEYVSADAYIDRLIGLYGHENVFIQIERSLLPWELSVNRTLLELAERRRIVPVAGGRITHYRPEHFPAQDMLVCVETLCAIDDVVGRKPLRHPDQPTIQPTPQRALNAERFLRTPAELVALYADHPELLDNTERVAERCDASVLPKRTELPRFCEDEPGLLRRLVMERAGQLPDTTLRKRRLELELQRIHKNRFSGHFLVAWDMCDWAREQGIVLSARGSVVDSAVAYCLGLSRVDAFEHDLHFDRFLPEDGSKRPDIDIDFEARRRDDVRNYLAQKYGNDHVATVGAVGTYGTRGIVREVGKVLGIPEECLKYLSKKLHGSVTPERLESEIDTRPELRDSGIPRERFRWVFRLAEHLMEVPRNLRSHSSGVIISSEPIAYTVPVVHSGADGVKIIQWDKRSTKRFFDKFDVLCLRGNDVLSDLQDRVRLQAKDFAIEKLPIDDENVFRAMRSGELIGVPQSASPAMRQAHIRLGTANLKDASIVQAAIRPGVGGAVKLNELIARRRGKYFDFAHAELDRILRPTYGIIVFQEQVDMLLQTFGGYTSDQAEEVREAIHKKRKDDYVKLIRQEVTSRIIARDFSPEVADMVYELVAVFQGYGFAEGHALAFADISIRSVWCQQNYPAEYFSALLDAQPAGYYGPCTLANEARVRGVKVLPPCVNRSNVNYKVEDVRAEDDPKIVLPNGGIRVSLSQLKNLSRATRERIVEERNKGLYASFFNFVARVRPQRDELEVLIVCGAFDIFHLNRRMLLWAVPRSMQFAGNCSSSLPFSIPEPELPDEIEDFTPVEKAVYERRFLELDVERHLMAFERGRVRAKGAVTAAEASRLPHKTKAIVVGNPIRLRFPPTVSGKRVMFFDLEDETGLLNVTCFNETYLRDGHAVICSRFVTLIGEAQERDGHIAFLASRVFPYQAELNSALQPLPIAVGDFLAK
ncbi:MAG: DNA polymerase III subunit alpha [Fimbriimonadaceae bacterium]